MHKYSFTDQFIKAQRERFGKGYSRKRKSIEDAKTTNLEDKFRDRDDFVDWACEQLGKQNGECWYCGTHILLIRKIIEKTRKDQKQTLFHGFRNAGPAKSDNYNNTGNGISNYQCRDDSCESDRCEELNSCVYGGIRGPSLEVDQKNPTRGYTKDNCVLACYFCNNDKSSIYPADVYKKYFGEARKRHFADVAKELGIEQQLAVGFESVKVDVYE